MLLTVADRFHFPPSEMWAMTQRELIYWADMAVDAISQTKDRIEEAMTRGKTNH